MGQLTHAPGKADREGIAQVMHRVGHDGGTVGQNPSNKFYYREAKIEEKGDRHALFSRGWRVPMALMPMV
ncbi:hypothetical protein GCM10027098_33340 [Bowmanella dokdonensis]